LSPDPPGEQDRGDEFGELGIINFLILVIRRYFPEIPVIRAGKNALISSNSGPEKDRIDL
jgi:hypothetical protein